MGPHEQALDGMMNDLDDLESKKMFGDKQDSNSGVDITISVVPKGGDPDADDYPEGHDIGMCKGGCAYHKGGMAMADGGVVPGAAPEDDDMTLPPFLRKKKLPINR